MAEEDDQEVEKETSDETEGGEGGEASEGGGGNKKLFIIIGAAVLLLVGGGAGAYFTGMLDGLLGKEEVAAHGEDHADGAAAEHGGAEGHGEEYDYGDGYGYEEDHSADQAAGHGEEAAAGGGHGAPAGDGHGAPAGDGHGGGGGKYVVVPTMLVNLNTDDGTPRFLRLSVQIELKSTADYPAVEAVLPRVVDQFQTYLRELRVKDLRGSAGIYRLQMELLWRVNQAAKPVRVKDVLFQEILIQ